MPSLTSRWTSADWMGPAQKRGSTAPHCLGGAQRARGPLGGRDHRRVLAKEGNRLTGRGSRCHLRALCDPPGTDRSVSAAWGARSLWRNMYGSEGTSDQSIDLSMAPPVTATVNALGHYRGVHAPKFERHLDTAGRSEPHI